MGELVGEKHHAACRAELGVQTEKPEMGAVMRFELGRVVQADRHVLVGGGLYQPCAGLAHADLSKRCSQAELCCRHRSVVDRQAVHVSVGNQGANAPFDRLWLSGRSRTLDHASCDLGIDGMHVGKVLGSAWSRHQGRQGDHDEGHDDWPEHACR